MKDHQHFDAIIIGGSYAGLSAAMALGRSLRSVLIIDSGKPCNRQTPHSHNFITQDGNTPAAISELARSQVLNYGTVKWHKGLAVGGRKTKEGFEITTDSGFTFLGKKIIFATGLKDLMPGITGFAECWGISVIHCPYCHGYEVRNEKTGLLGNGDFSFEFAKIIHHWTTDLCIYTNGTASFDKEQKALMNKHGIQMNEKPIKEFVHYNGQIDHILFKDGHREIIKVIYARPKFSQHCNIAATLGCEITEQGLIKVNEFQKTSIAGIWACGDNCSPMRSVANAVYSGSLAGAMLNKEMIEEDFK